MAVSFFDTITCMKYEAVLDFWFGELTEDDQFNGGERIDQLITERFSDVHAAAVAGELVSWRENQVGSLAEIIVLDQFSRNIYRGKREAFAADEMALMLAAQAVEKGFDQLLPPDKRLFVYMPYMHSEIPAVHEVAVKLFTDLGDREALKYEKIHKDIIDRFSRYPHRNKQLGRENTTEEDAYLNSTQHGFFSS